MRNALLSLVLAFFAASQLHAQRPAYYFFELGGPAGLASMNIEVNPIGGLRTRLGAGLFLWLPSIPVMATYTFGSERNSLEIGVGATAILVPAETGSDRELFNWGAESGTLLIATGAVGYRHRTDGGFLFRATMTPLYGDGHAVMWVGISLGHAF